MKEPAWLTHAIDQRIALLEEAIGGKDTGHAIIMTPLFEPGPGTTREQFEKWEFICDNPGCGKYDPKGSHAGHAVRQLRDGRPVYMGFGVCDSCYRQLTA